MCPFWWKQCYLEVYKLGAKKEGLKGFVLKIISDNLGVAFGFPFIEYELKSEGIFYETKCSNGTHDIWGPGKKLCTDALKLYNTLFTVAVVSCTIGVFLTGFILDKIGMFWTRMFYCTITTLGNKIFSLRVFHRV